MEVGTLWDRIWFQSFTIRPDMANTNFAKSESGQRQKLDYGCVLLVVV